jgi:hypothetical protein
VPPAGAVGDAEGEEEEGEGEGGGDFDGGWGVRLGLGVGVAVAESGRAAHDVAVLAPDFVPALGWVLLLGLAVLLGLGLWLGLGLALRLGPVLALLGLGLAEVLGLGETAASLAPLACAVPGKPATTPMVREPPASTLSTAARRCARRMKKTPLSSLLIEVTVCFSCDSETTW